MTPSLLWYIHRDWFRDKQIPHLYSEENDVDAEGAYMEAIKDDSCTHIFIDCREYTDEDLRNIYRQLKKHGFHRVNRHGFREVWENESHFMRNFAYSPRYLPDILLERFMDKTSKEWKGVPPV